MKKSLKAAALLLLSVGMLAGCNGGNGTSTTGDNSESTSGTSQSTGGNTESSLPTITVEEGKQAFLVKVSSASVKLKAFNSIWLTGCMTEDAEASWATGLNAIEMKPVEGAEGYYVGFGKWDPTTYTGNQKGEYQLVVGYNASADIADAKKGLQWNDSYKSDVAASLGGLNNPSFIETAQDNVYFLGADETVEHTFTAQPGTPSPALANLTLKVTFSMSIPEYIVPHIMGSFDGWNTKFADEEAHRMVTSDEERKVWTYKIEQVYADDYAYTVSMDYATSTNYRWAKPVEVDAQNGTFTVAQIMGDDFELDLGTLTVTESQMPDPNKTVGVKVVVNSTTAVTGTVYMKGSYDWGADPVVLAPADDTNKVFTVELTGVKGGDLEFGIISDASWTHKMVGAEGANIKVSIDNSHNNLITVNAGDLSAVIDGETAVGEIVSANVTEWATEAAA